MSYDNYQALNVSVDRGVAFVSIDHGEINLMDMTLLVDLDRVSRELQADQAVKVVVLQSANPDFFVAHADVTLIQMLPATPAPREDKLAMLHIIGERFRTMKKATIAKIEGRCRGGGSELVLACDMRFAAVGKAVLGQPEVGVGIIPGGGGTVRLPRLLGRARAMEIILGGADFSAELAERYGYVNRALPAAEITGFVNTLAYRIASFPAEAIALAKEAANMADVAIEDDLAREERLFLQSAHTAGAKLRMAAAMAVGFQTPEIEKRCFDDIWSLLPAVQ